MSQLVASYWKFCLIKSLQRSPLVFAGWVLLSIYPEATPSAASQLPESISASESAIADDTLIPRPRPAGVMPELVRSPQFSQSSQASSLLAQAITPAADGTGTVVNQAGNTFEITGGTQAGDNLFHSFQQFGLSADQAATILSNPDIANILGRVVGGDASFINGLLQVTGGNSNLFLINPAGIIFGPDATVVMPAALTATTADAVQIGDYWFEAMGTADYANLIGEPTGFAFATDTPGMVINAGTLTAAPDSVVTLLGGFVLNTGSIATPGGTINIATVPGENLVRITPEGSLLSLDLPLDAPEANPDLDVLTANDLPALLAGAVTPEELGVVVEGDTVRLVTTNTEIPTDAGTTIIAGSLDTSETSLEGMGGEIVGLGEQVALIDADLNASGTVGGGTILIGGDYQGQGDIPNADFTYIDSNSSIKADALEAGDGGTVIVWADDTTQFFGDISAQGGSESGDGGFVEVSGKENLGFNGTVDVSANNGEVGTLLLDPRNITIDTVGINDAGFTGKIAANADPDNFSISATRIVELLATGNVDIAATDKITVDAEILADNTPQTSLSLTADLIALNNSIAVNNGSVTFKGPVFVGTDIAINTGTGKGDITFENTLNGVANGTDLSHTIKLFAGNGDIVFKDSVGLYRSIPGSNSFTFQIADINLGSEGSDPGPFTVIGDLVYFAADDGIVGRELWRSDGTQSGTFLVKDIYPGERFPGEPYSSFPRELTDVDGTLFFSANDGVTGRELWRSDGTAAGTILFADIFPGTDNNFPNDSSPSNLTNVDGTLFFAANDGINGTELWRTNDAGTGVELFANIFPGNNPGSSPNELTNVNGTLFFAANDGINGIELWRTNDSGTGVELLADINPGGLASFPQEFTNVNGTLFFVANNGTNGQALWRINEVGDGVQLFADINPNTGGTQGPSELTAVGDTLFFAATNGITGRALWRINEAGTAPQLIADIDPSPSDSIDGPEELTSLNGNLFFIVNNGISGPSLWRSGGEADNTVFVTDIDPSDRRFGRPINLAAFNGNLLLSASNGVNGSELWSSNGEPDSFPLGNLEIIIDNAIAPNPAGEIGANSVFFENQLYAEGLEAVTQQSFTINGAAAIVDSALKVTSLAGGIETGTIFSNSGFEELPVVLNAAQDLNIGDILTENSPVELSSGGRIQTGDIQANGLVELIAENSIRTGSIDSGFGGDASVNLQTQTGDIEVQTIFSTNGIKIDAAQQFRALGATSAVVRTLSDDQDDVEDRLPSELISLLAESDYEDLSGFESIEPRNFLVSLEAEDSAIEIRFGQNRQEIFNTLKYELDGDGDFIVGEDGMKFPISGILIEGDPESYFIVGPEYDDANPITITEVDDGSTLIVEINSSPLIYPSQVFPEGTSGTIAGILSSRTDQSLEGSLQSQSFGELPPTKINPANPNNPSESTVPNEASNLANSASLGVTDEISETDRLRMENTDLCKNQTFNNSSTEILEIDEVLLDNNASSISMTLKDPCLQTDNPELSEDQFP